MKVADTVAFCLGKGGDDCIATAEYLRGRAENPILLYERGEYLSAVDLKTSIFMDMIEQAKFI